VCVLAGEGQGHGTQLTWVGWQRISSMPFPPLQSSSCWSMLNDAQGHIVNTAATANMGDKPVLGTQLCAWPKLTPACPAGQRGKQPAPRLPLASYVPPPQLQQPQPCAPVSQHDR
jgi:hypothetical protein